MFANIVANITAEHNPRNMYINNPGIVLIDGKYSRNPIIFFILNFNLLFYELEEKVIRAKQSL